MAGSIYLDYNATAPLLPQVKARMLEVMDAPHNPSSVHHFGRQAKKLLEDARTSVAASVSAFPQEIIFTASGTEANNWALNVFPDRRVLVSAVEHPSVLRAAPQASIIPVDDDGVVRLDALAEMLDGSPALVSVMLANNETGAVQPIEEIATICKTKGALLHCDAAQGLGRIRVDFGQLGADLLTITSHKCGGPVGAAALVVKSGLQVPPMLRGGSQESLRRAGTENLLSIVGFATACEQAADVSCLTDLQAWIKAMEAELAACGAVVMGAGATRLPNTSCIAMPGASGEVQLMHFDLSGIAVSAGSACSSGRIGKSHVLAAMGVPEQLAASAIRVSGGWDTKEADIRLFVEAWQALSQRMLHSRAKAVS